jgi:hypothetical protein
MKFYTATAIVFFTLGVISYFFIPKDFTPRNSEKKIEQSKVVLEEENGCYLYQDQYIIDGKEYTGGNTQASCK